jgi:hypothetical protein
MSVVVLFGSIGLLAAYDFSGARLWRREIGESGDVYVLRAGPAYELLATNATGEALMATPAASDGLLVLRTTGHLVGIGAAK